MLYNNEEVVDRIFNDYNFKKVVSYDNANSLKCFTEIGYDVYKMNIYEDKRNNQVEYFFCNTSHVPDVTEDVLDMIICNSFGNKIPKEEMKRNLIRKNII